MIARLTVEDLHLSWDGGRVRCAVGKGGLRTGKREGDGATPVGCFALRELWYRADRMPAPPTGLALRRIRPDSGWSDDPGDPLYNRAIKLPHPHSHERLFREDWLYDLVVPLGYNDEPPIPGLGSAIFLHCAQPDYAPTQGCVAIARSDLIALLAHCDSHTWIDITEPTATSILFV